MTNQQTTTQLTPWQQAQQLALQYQMAQQSNPQALLGMVLGRFLKNKYQAWRNRDLSQDGDSLASSLEAVPEYNEAATNQMATDYLNERVPIDYASGLLGAASLLGGNDIPFGASMKLPPIGRW